MRTQSEFDKFDSDFEKMERFIKIVIIGIFTFSVIIIIATIIAGIILGPELWRMLNYIVYGD